MNTTSRGTLNVKIVGFDPGLRNKLSSSSPQARAEYLTLEECAGSPSFQALDSLWIVTIDRTTELFVDSLKVFLDRTKDSAPLFWLPELAQKDQFSSRLLRGWLDAYGATLFEGPGGFKQLCGYLQLTAERPPHHVIVSLSLSDDGLHVHFADNARARIPFAEVKRLAEVEDIQWDSVRIAGDRTFITLSSRDNAGVPIPHDVLREYVSAESSKRRSANSRERKLTGHSFGIKLKTLRETQGLTQEYLAARTESSRWTIIRIEKGSYLPKVALLEKIARALGMPLEDLFSR
jgi:DNA-binding XRE family transcriptional regulator